MPPRRPRSSPRPDPILDLLAEAGLLKSVRRSGWWMIGIKNGESVAEHSFRTALLGYLLAKMEQLDPYPVVMMGLLNDLHEARINDLHKVGHRYIDFPAAERKAAAEQTAGLPPAIRADLTRWHRELSAQRTRASRAARDADLLECMIQGKEYFDQGRPRAIEWTRRPMHLLRTKSARALARRLLAWRSDRWWQHLVTLAR
ncbi:MAG: HD domain-containing protein [Candidatus Omnitrophica bacterium]|nr:HD domain-containing protein [Candidatus Omnitrophota bacterium]